MYYIIMFSVDAKKYFELDPERKVSENDVVIVFLDLYKKRAEYAWVHEDGDLSDFPVEEDGFDGVLSLWKELGHPVEDLAEAYEFDEDEMENSYYVIMFSVDAKKYFELDPERKVSENDVVIVFLDLYKKRAEYAWVPEGGNPSDFPAEEDDFDGVWALWEELGRPVEDLAEVHEFDEDEMENSYMKNSPKK
jgi:hypothetical protein